MKKVLFATTALVAFAGAAAAEVKVGGDARMGLTYDESRAQETLVNTRVRIKFTASGTTDGGLDWEATSRVRTGDEGGASVNAFNELATTISGAFGSLTFGSESSAAEYAVGDLAGVGYGPQLTQNETTFITGARVLYSYSATGFTVYLSSGQLGSDVVSIGAQYSANGLTIGLGYEDNGANSDHTVGSVAYAMGDTTVKAVYGTADLAGTDFEQMGISVAHKMGATTLEAFYRTTETGGVDADFYGIGADYALGGGATLSGGFVSDDGNTEANLGLRFSF